ncbi:MAG TPA: GGDEF domain-containing protein [Xanthobacteraceae bacterium]|nr:GGDEF domain-containing protein [Xanthobacteraceae bacterium]
MLSVSTLFLVFVVNFISLSLVWLYVMRSYPRFGAARFWAAASGVATIAAVTSLFRGYIPPIVPILIGGGFFIFAGFLASLGIQRLFERPLMWRTAFAVTGAAMIGLSLFTLWHDNMPARIFVYSVAQSIAVAVSLPTLFSRLNGAPPPGARLTGYIALLCIATYWFRTAAALFKVGGEVNLIEFNDVQAGLLVLLVFSSMALNFGFLLMAIDRLREEVANLALSDDLTGAANRRQLQKRLDEECARSNRTQEPLALLMIDIDNFKTLNDTQGHAAGDECLRMLTHSIQSRLRSGDLLVRMGGDEFCAVLPSTTLREGSIMARRVLDACRMEWTAKNCAPIPISASVGLAQWRSQIGEEPDRLIAEADRALYAAKRSGKDRYAIHEPVEAEPLRRTA